MGVYSHYSLFLFTSMDDNLKDFPECKNIFQMQRLFDFSPLRIWLFPQQTKKKKTAKDVKHFMPIEIRLFHLKITEIAYIFFFF